MLTRSSSQIKSASLGFDLMSRELQLSLSPVFRLLTSFAHSPAHRAERLVWPLPRSLATTSGISVDFFSSPYLDVSVQAVPYICLFYSTYVDGVLLRRVSPFGYLRFVAYVPLPAAFRSLSRPSSAPDAKAFPLRPY